MAVADNVVASVSAAVDRVQRDLARRPHLRPCPEVDALFGELVGLVASVPPGSGLPGCRQHSLALRRLCAEGETQLELEWGERIALAADPQACLAGFPYLDNYRRLARLELDTLARVPVPASPAAGRFPRRVVFLGAGPLPLSALLVADALEAPVDAVDCDPIAVDAGRRVADALSRGSQRVRFVEGDALTLDVADYDLVMVAALVGATPVAKQAVLRRLAGAMRPGSLLLARSARAARTLLYPPIEPAQLAGFAVHAVVHPVDDVINSVVVATATAPGLGTGAG
jgi:SAM-dependent methyltransferase